MVPDPLVTLTVEGNKFSRAGVRVVRETEADMTRLMKMMQIREREREKREAARCDYHQSYPGTCEACEANYERKFGSKNKNKTKHQHQQSK